MITFFKGLLLYFAAAHLSFDTLSSYKIPFFLPIFPKTLVFPA